MGRNKVINGQPYVYAGIYGLATEPVDINDKDSAVKLYVQQALCRTQSMFKYKNLPETIPKRSLELYIQTGGSACITEVNGDLYAFFGTFGGEPDAYYMPRSYIVANPALNFSKELRIHEECVVIPNDSMYLGLMPIFRRYATLLAENDVSLYIADINLRIISLVTGNTDRDIASAELYFEKVKKGDLVAALSTPFMEGLKAQPYGERGGNLVTQLIELQQYYKASMFNDIGLNSNYNMKRETIVSAEVELNADALFPFVDNMLECRQKAIEEVNKLFGTNIGVELDSSWEDLSDQREVQDIMEEAEALSMIDGGGEPPIMGNGFDSSQLDTGEEPEESEESSQLDNPAEEAENGEGNENASDEENDSGQTLPQQEEQDSVDISSDAIEEALIERLAEVVDEHDDEHIEVEDEVKETLEKGEESESDSEPQEEEETDAEDEEKESDSE